MIFDYNMIWENLPLYFGGLLTTLKLLAISLAFGLLAALPLGLMRVSKKPVGEPAGLAVHLRDSRHADAGATVPDLLRAGAVRRGT